MKQSATVRLEQLQADAERTPEVKETLTKLYQQVLVDLGATEQAVGQRLEWTQKVDAAPAALETARQSKEKLKEQPTDEGLLFMSFEEGQARLRELEAKLATATAERSK